ncbi:helix-turn-helix domain-containing protein [Roseospira marina]|uniref:Helix-turn-helix domain-containing protein n=1 Tax=Roseospira marina TaxID=140057 RepID=A0A5M6IEY5_9PROT|nr:helix-turn-helix domain-containing protein [Roseospira marina]
MEVGEQIKTLRLAAGLSQRELAAAAGLHQSALSAMERGEGKDGPTYRKLRMIAKAMGLRMVFVPNEVRENTASHAVEAVCTPSPGKQYRISGSEKVASKQSRKFRSLLSTQVRALNVPSKTKTRRA